jgi:hypothetical protein
MPWIIGGALLGGAGISALSADNAASKQQAGTDKAIAATQQGASQARADLAPYRQAGTAALSRLQALMGIGGPGVDDPKLAAIKNQLTQQADQAHQQQFGMSIFDPRSGLSAPGGRDRFDQQINDQATQQYQQQYGGAAQPAGGGDLLRKFSTSDLNADPVYQSGLQFGLGEGVKGIERRAAAGGGYDSGQTLKALTRFGNDYGSTKAADAYSRFTNDQNNIYGRLSGVAGMGTGATNVGVGAGTNAAGNLASLQSGQGNAAGAASIAQGNAFSSGINQFANLYGQNQMLQQLQGGGARTLAPNHSLTGASDLGAVG